MKSLPLILLLFNFNLCFCQIEITGQTVDLETNLPIQNVNIIIQKKNSEKINNYTFSDIKGFFTIVSDNKLDSIYLKVGVLGYSSQLIKIINQKQTLKIKLKQSVDFLNEIIIVPDEILKIGDTLSYEVSSFKDKNDRVIADLIKRLPGIEVEPNGRILYQGEPINKYYIEGLDLLNGRYKMANDNLNIDAVQSIEIIENHQPISMLNSLVFSDKAALNIKLKKKYSNTGQVTAAAGFIPLLWDENITPMLFSKNLQIIGTFQANNVGKNISNQTFQLTQNTFESFSFGGSQKMDWVGIQKLTNPAFNENRWLDNNAKMVSFNILKKIKNDIEVRLTSDFSSDIQTQEGSTKSTFFNSENENIQLIEYKKNKLGFNSLKSELSLQKNTKSKYLKNSLKVNSIWDSQNGKIDGTNGIIFQKTFLPNFMISNDFQDFFRLKMNVLTFSSSAILEKKPQNLIASPGSFIDLLNNGNNYEQSFQNVLKTKFFTENSVQTIKRIFKISIDNQLGLSIDRENLISNIMVKNFSENTAAMDAFTNNLNWINDRLYLKSILRYNLKNWKFSLNIPLTYYMLRAEDKVLAKNLQLDKFAIEPRLNLNNAFKNFWNTNISFGKSNGFSDINQVYFGYILANYREIKRYNAPIQQIVNFSGSISLNYRNPINNVFGGISYINTFSSNNIIFSNSINSNGSLEINAQELNNESNVQSINSRIGKYFREIKTTFSLKNNLSKQAGFQIINEKLSKVGSFSVKPNLEVNSNFSNWVGLTYSYNFSSFKNIIEEVSKPIVNQQSHFFKLNINLKNNFYFGLNNEYYINNFNQQKNIFSDVLLRKTIGKRKVDLEFNWNNIFNRNEIISINSGIFSYIETTSTLRPSQAIFKVRFSY